MHLVVRKQDISCESSVAAAKVVIISDSERRKENEIYQSKRKAHGKRNVGWLNVDITKIDRSKWFFYEA